MKSGGFAVIPLLIIVAALAAVVGLGLVVFNPGQKAPSLNGNGNAVACTQDAKLCPDGSYVGRVAPNCEFAECPTANATNDANAANGNANTANTDVTVNANIALNVNTNSSVGNKYCQRDEDCGLLICSGCFSKDFLKTAPPDLACRTYEGYTCRCVNQRCEAARPATKNVNTQPTDNFVVTYEVSQVLQKPASYDDQPLCLHGPYQSSFEFSAFGAGSKLDADGRLRVTEPYVWYTGSIDPSVLTCWDNADGERTCSGTTTLCGTFRYAAPGEPGLGHVGAYRYALE
ncbi:MAG: hypothetical protein HY567_04335 [Candidatus Kerfeldbacteria bacterium]|nr:hypothetical protein [Candidatus Kerfeldbacteria bacterium]